MASEQSGAFILHNFKEGKIMALKMTKSITLSGNSEIDGNPVQGYQATIDSEHPENMSISSWINDQVAYKANRAQCRKDAAEFEDTAYELQDEMIAALEEK